MFRTFRKMFGHAPEPDRTAEIRIDRVTYAVGDIHGRTDLLNRLLGIIETDAAETCGAEPPRLIFLGDYVDRGEDSASVLERLQTLETEPDWDVTFLRGNHEVMLEEFLVDPVGAAPRWLRNGGLETLLSFEVRGALQNSTEAALRDARDRLVERMGPLMDWFDRLAASAVHGNVAFIHAGGNPGLPIEQQSEQDLYWGARSFGTEPRTDGLWVVHGHYIVETPQISERRIAVDTGAYHSGRLTAARIETGSVHFLST